MRHAKHPQIYTWIKGKVAILSELPKNEETKGC